MENFKQSNDMYVTPQRPPYSDLELQLYDQNDFSFKTIQNNKKLEIRMNPK